MLTLVRKRTKVRNDDGWIIDELNSALRWSWRQLYLTNPDIKLTFGTTGTLSSDSQALDLTTAVNADIYGIKTFWIKGTSDTEYVPVVFKDENDPDFIALNQLTPVQVIHPVLCAIYNFNQLRFGNQLPSGTAWKADWIGTPPPLSLDTECVTTYPEPLHDALTDRAIAVIFDSLDDIRAAEWFALAQQDVTQGGRVVKRRQFQTKATTAPYPGRTGRGRGFSPRP